MRNHETNPDLHAVMLVSVTYEHSEPGKLESDVAKGKTVVHDGKTLMVSKASSFVSSDKREVVAFLKGNCCTAGFTVQFAVNPVTEEVAHVMKKGRLCQRDVKSLLERGFTEWTFSWAFAPTTFRFPSGRIVEVTEEVDLVKVGDVRPWKCLASTC